MALNIIQGEIRRLLTLFSIGTTKLAPNENMIVIIYLYRIFLIKNFRICLKFRIFVLLM